jgi:hypothetical protein
MFSLIILHVTYHVLVWMTIFSLILPLCASLYVIEWQNEDYPICTHLCGSQLIQLRSLDLIPFPATVQKGEFLKLTVRSTSPSKIRRFPLPPAATPAARGWRNHGSRRVHSVGSSRSPADGVEEWQRGRSGVLRRRSASLVVGLRGASLQIVCPPRAGRSAELLCVVFPSRIPRSSGSDDVLILKKLLMLSKATASSGAGWRLFEFEVGRLPVRRGTAPDPRLVGSSSGGAPSARPHRPRRRRDPEGLMCYFSLFLDIL